MSNSREMMERGDPETRGVVIIDDGSQIKKAILALLTGDFVVGDLCLPIEIECIPLPCEVRCNLGIDKSFTPPHKKNRRGKLKRSGR